MPFKDPEAFNEYLRQRYERRLAEAKVRLGGRCHRCGGTEQLQFDHIDPRTKTMKVSVMTRFSQEKFDAEVAKCQLLCHPCHIDKTREGGENRRNHGRLAER